MSARELVRERWDEVARRHGCEPAAARKVLDELAAAYADPHRAYHTLEHIAVLLRLLEEHGDRAADHDALVLAILFHDAVYDPARADNEAASAELAAARLTGLGVPQATVAKAARFIRATQHGADPGGGEESDLALILDLDLSVLAASPDAYRAYAQAIRREYAHYPEETYRQGRRRVLEAFLARERIYRTEHLHAVWEARARENLAREIADLG